MRLQRHAVIAAAVVALTLGTAGVAQATPPTGEVSGTILAEWDAFGKHYVHRLVYLGQDSATGWHYHDGMLYARVVQGSCTTTTRRARRMCPARVTTTPPVSSSSSRTARTTSTSA